MKEPYNNNQQQQQDSASGHENRDSNSSNSATAVNAANNNHVLVLQDIPEDDDEPPIRPFTTDQHYQQKQEYNQRIQETGNDSPRSSISSTVISPSNLLSPTSFPSTRQSSFSTANHVPFSGNIDSASLILKKRPFDRDPVDLANYLHTSLATGLSDQEAKQRLEKVGKNLLKGQEKVSIWNVLWRQVSNAMTVILLGALAIAFATQDFAEGGVIAAIVAANVGIGFFQEYRAERTMESLRKLSSPTASVLRITATQTDGSSATSSPHLIQIPTSDIVPGDIVELRTGQVVPADLRIFSSLNLEIDESLLTGESLPILKSIETIYPASSTTSASSSATTLPQSSVGRTDVRTSRDDAGDVPLGDCFNLAYAGTIVTKGRGKGIVYATGMSSEIGKIASALNSNKPQSSNNSSNPTTRRKRLVILLKKVLGLYNASPLQLKLTKLAHFLFITAVVLVLVVFATSKFNVSADVALYAISLALAIIPESLIAVVTITMAKGVTHMAKRNAIVRRLDAIEALGGVTDICSDKTGTLTTGRMVVRKVWDGKSVWNIEGGDLSAREIEIQCLDEKTSHQEINEILRCVGLCNSAVVTKKDEGWHANGEPTEIALQIFAAKAGFLKSDAVAMMEDVQTIKDGVRYKHVQEHHFDSTVKRMTVIYHDLQHKTNVAFMKGAPERVVDACMYSSNGDILTPPAKEYIINLMDRFASEGLRVLALASKVLKEETLDRAKVESEMTFLGLIGIYDPPRPESLNAVQECQRAGIIVHMLTGDHITTATAIAKEVGILTPSTQTRSSILTAHQFDRMSEQEIDELPSLPLVIARCSPATKVKMVQALHRRGRLTAMTGDGVNDSPSLKTADVGIAMGKNGSDVARQASEIVLADDNFATIVGAVEEGRRIFDNLVKFMLHLMTSNCAEVIVLVMGLAFVDGDGQPVYPLSPVQILWENLITSAFPAFALGLEPAAHDVMLRPPHNVISGVFNKEFASDIIVYGIIMGAAPLLCFVIVVYAVGNGMLGTDCNHTLSTSCDVVYRARAAVFSSLTVLILLHAFEMKHSRQSIFTMNLLKNKPLFISVVGGCLALFPTIYIPGLNTTVFRMEGITWEWGLCVASVVFYIVLAEAYKALKRRYWKKESGMVHLGNVTPGVEMSRNTTVETLK